jgi:hypothetical protein
MTVIAGAAAAVIGAAAGPAAASTATARPPHLIGGTLSVWWASGYEAVAKPGPGNASSFTHIDAYFTVPLVNCHPNPPDPPPSEAQFRVGLGQGSIERVGVSETCTPGSLPRYWTWYQLVSETGAPLSNPLPVNVPSVHVHPGDVLHASVSADGDFYTLAMMDLTTGKHFSVGKTYPAGNNSTAQVTAGSPGPTPPPPPFVPPADFGAVSYSRINIVDNLHTAGGFVNPKWNYNTLVQPPVPGSVHYTLAGPLAGLGTAFMDLWK